MFKLNHSDSCQLRIQESLDAYKEATPFRYTDSERYIAILNEYFKKESVRRINLFKKVNTSKQAKIDVLHHISKRENIGDFMSDWCWTYDPRLSALGLPTILPWIPWPRQLEFIEWFYNLYLSQRSGLVEKSRDMGITWLFCLLSVFEWRWTEGFAGGIGSNKLDNVDKKDEPDSIFEKIRKLIQLLPNFWMPEQFDWRKHDKVGNLVNPLMKSQIGGQGGKDIGRGGRRSFYLVDESASLEFPQAADAALSQVTNCQIDLSTPKGMNHFGQKRHSGRLPVFTFHWRDDPRKNDDWYEFETSRLDPVVVAQELNIDYQASVEGLFVETKWIESAVAIKLKPNGVRTAGLDVAAGGSNKSALGFRFGPCFISESFDFDNGADLTHMAIDKCNDAQVEALHYDKLGVGFAVTSTINRTEVAIKFPYFGLDAGGSPSDIFYEEFDKFAKDVFTNARAEWWYRIARRFEKTHEHFTGKRTHPEEELISIENDGQLIAELASTKKFRTENGKIKAESKDQMLKRGIKSPDLADACVLAFLPTAGGNKHIMENFQMQDTVHINWDQPEHRVKHYGALVIDKDLSISLMCAIWDEQDCRLMVYSDYKAPTPNSDEISELIIQRMQLETVTIDRLMGNKVMFGEHKKTFNVELNKKLWDRLSQVQTIKIREPRKYDPIGSVAALIQLNKENNLKIDFSCSETARQFATWKLEKSKFEHTGMQEAILMIVSELMLYTPFQQAIRKKPDYKPIIEHIPHIDNMGPMEV